MKTYKINIIATALTRITHMQGVKGNESLINREGMYYNGKIIQIPFLSGNAIRHKMIREPGTYDIIKTCDLKGKLSIEQLNFMLNGGSLTESSISVNINKIYTMQQLLPLYRLLGGSLKNQILSGSLNVSFGFLFCKENKNRISQLLGNDSVFNNINLKSYEHFIGSYQYTRSSAKNHKGAVSLIKDDGSETNENLMIYNGQTIIPGSVFFVQFNLINCDEIELGALLNALKCYIANGCDIGGMARIGHGKISIEFLEDNFDYDVLIANYKNHVSTNSIAIYNWLNEAFPLVNKTKIDKKKKKEKTEDLQTENNSNFQEETIQSDNIGNKEQNLQVNMFDSLES